MNGPLFIYTNVPGRPRTRAHWDSKQVKGSQRYSGNCREVGDSFLEALHCACPSPPSKTCWIHLSIYRTVCMGMLPQCTVIVFLSVNYAMILLEPRIFFLPATMPRPRPITEWADIQPAIMKLFHYKHTKYCTREEQGVE